MRRKKLCTSGGRKMEGKTYVMLSSSQYTHVNKFFGDANICFFCNTSIKTVMDRTNETRAAMMAQPRGKFSYGSLKKKLDLYLICNDCYDELADCMKELYKKKNNNGEGC